MSRMTSVGAILALCTMTWTGEAADRSPSDALSPAALCEGYGGLPADDGPHPGMVWIEGGRFTMGDDDERPESAPRTRSRSRASGSIATR